VKAEIRPARAGDIPAIHRLVRDAYAVYVPRIGREPAPLSADYDALVAEGAVSVAVDGDLVVGVLVLRPEPASLLLENVAVAPAAQRGGIGRRLIAFAEQRAGDLGLETVRLYTNARMTENLSYYAALGYVEVDRRREDGFDRVFFSKRVGGAGIRLANAQDIEAAVAVWAKANARPQTGGHANRIRSWSAQDGAHLFVAFDREQRVVGTVLSVLGREADGAGDIAPGRRHLIAVAVLPEHQGAGIGRRLLRASLDDAQAEGMTRLTLWARVADSGAVRFFQAFGFQLTGRTERDQDGELALLELVIGRERLSRPLHPIATPT